MSWIFSHRNFINIDGISDFKYLRCIDFGKNYLRELAPFSDLPVRPVPTRHTYMGHINVLRETVGGGGQWRLEIRQRGGSGRKKSRIPSLTEEGAKKICQGGSIAFFPRRPNLEGGQGPLVSMVQALLGGGGWIALKNLTISYGKGEGVG